MRKFATQMEAARKGIVTDELKKAAAKEHMTAEEMLPLVAAGKVVICANNRLYVKDEDKCKSRRIQRL